MATEPAGGTGRLGAFDIGCVVVGGIVGVGIFFTPQRVAAAVDGPVQVIAAWSLGGAMALLGAFVFAALARRVPGHGGTFVYLRAAFGPAPAFLYGWANWFVVQSGALATIGLVMAEYLDRLVWGAAHSSMDAKVAVAVLAILAFTAVNLLGLRVGRRVQNALTAVKVAAVFALVLLALLAHGAPAAADAHDAAPAAAPRGWLLALSGAMLPVLYSFGGWQQGSFIAGAARRPERDVPLGIVGGVAVVVLAYLTVNLAFLDLLGFEGAAASEAIAEDAARTALAPHGLGDVAGRAISAAVVVSSLGIINTICMAPPFVLHAMAREGLFFRAVGRLHPTSGAPVVGVLVQGLWGAALLLVTYSLRDAPGEALAFLLDGIVFVDWLFYGACGLALLRLRRGENASRPFAPQPKWPLLLPEQRPEALGPRCDPWLLPSSGTSLRAEKNRRGRSARRGTALLPLAFAACAFTVTAGAVWTRPVPSSCGLALVALGLVFFVRMRRGGRASAPVVRG